MSSCFMLRRNITDTTGSVQYSGGSNQAWSLRRVKLSKTKALAFRGTLFFRKLPTTKGSAIPRFSNFFERADAAHHKTRVSASHSRPGCTKLWTVHSLFGRPLRIQGEIHHGSFKTLPGWTASAKRYTFSPLNMQVSSASCIGILRFSHSQRTTLYLRPSAQLATAGTIYV